MRWLALVVLVSFVHPARADPWYSGDAGKRRIIRLSAIAAASGLYITSETVLKDPLSPDACRWCSVDSLDANVRDALVWSDRPRAQTFSNVTAGLTVVTMLGLPMLASSGADDRVARILDDAIPVLETFIGTELLVEVIKDTVGRQRPEVHYNTDASRKPALDDNASFPSGHTAFAFALATGAGVVAHRRGYGLEPVIWATGLTLAASTAYFRIAGDKHYLTDVSAGGALGVLAGFVIPRLTGSLPDDVVLTPMGNGVALVGSF